MAKNTNPWLQLVKKKYYKIKEEKDISGAEALRKAIDEARKSFKIKRKYVR